MKISVITPYLDEPLEMLEKCHSSISNQTVKAVHILVADGKPKPEPEEWNCEHIILPCSHKDYGGTPRALAALSAFQRGSEAVCFLDADNWYEPDHLEILINLHEQSKADVCISSRQLYSVSGEKLPAAHEDGIENFADTNCLWLTGAAIKILPSWIYMGPHLSACGDFLFYQEIKAAGLKIARGKNPTVCYRTRWKGHYEKAGLRPPENAETEDVTAATCAWFRNLPGVEREKLRRHFLSALDVFRPDEITLIDDSYMNIPSGTALKVMTQEHIFSFSGSTCFHIPKEYFPKNLAFSGVVLGIAAMDDWKLEGTLIHRGRETALNDGYYFEHSINWTRIDHDLKFEINAGDDRRIKLAWWIIPFTWRDKNSDNFDE